MKFRFFNYAKQYVFSTIDNTLQEEAGSPSKRGNAARRIAHL